MARRAWMSWSSGKDSAFALDVLRGEGEWDVVGLLTTITEPFDRVSMHGVRRVLLESQAERLGLPLHPIEIPAPCPNEVYEARMDQAIAAAKAAGVEGIAFGDLFLEDVRAYRERMLAPTGIAPVFPLWGRPTDALADEMIRAGVRATVTCLDPTKVPRELAGARWDAEFIARAGPDVDPCGEHGEFHTFVFDGPGFSHAIDIRQGEVVERDGFVFADVMPAS